MPAAKKNRKSLKQKDDDKTLNESKSPNSRRKKQTPKKMNALTQIKSLQRASDLLIRKQPFVRLVRDISISTNPEINRWQTLALRALHEASEAYLIQLFADCNHLAQHAKRVTVKPTDMQLAMFLSRDPNFVYKAGNNPF